MAKYELAIAVDVKKDGQPFYEEAQKSYNLDDVQFLEMEQDLFELKSKWAGKSGLKV